MAAMAVAKPENDQEAASTGMAAQQVEERKSRSWFWVLRGQGRRGDACAGSIRQRHQWGRGCGLLRLWVAFECRQQERSRGVRGSGRQLVRRHRHTTSENQREQPHAVQHEALHADGVVYIPPSVCGKSEHRSEGELLPFQSATCSRAQKQGALTNGTPGALTNGTPDALTNGTPGALTNGTPDAPADVHKVEQEEHHVSSCRAVAGRMVQPLVPEPQASTQACHPVDDCSHGHDKRTQTSNRQDLLTRARRLGTQAQHS